MYAIIWSRLCVTVITKYRGFFKYLFTLEDNYLARNSFKVRQRFYKV